MENLKTTFYEKTLKGGIYGTSHIFKNDVYNSRLRIDSEVSLYFNLYNSPLTIESAKINKSGARIETRVSFNREELLAIRRAVNIALDNC